MIEYSVESGELYGQYGGPSTALQQNKSGIMLLSVLLFDSRIKFRYILKQLHGYTTWDNVIFKLVESITNKCQWCQNEQQLGLFNLHKSIKDSYMSANVSRQIPLEHLHASLYHHINDFQRSKIFLTPPVHIQLKPGCIMGINRQHRVSTLKPNVVSMLYINCCNTGDQTFSKEFSAIFRYDTVTSFSHSSSTDHFMFYSRQRTTSVSLKCKDFPMHIPAIQSRQPQTEINFIVASSENKCNLTGCYLWIKMSKIKDFLLRDKDRNLIQLHSMHDFEVYQNCRETIYWCTKAYYTCNLHHAQRTFKSSSTSSIDLSSMKNGRLLNARDIRCDQLLHKHGGKRGVFRSRREARNFCKQQHKSLPSFDARQDLPYFVKINGRDIWCNQLLHKRGGNSLNNGVFISWQEASNFCKQRNMSLPSFYSRQDILYFVKQIFPYNIKRRTYQEIGIYIGFNKGVCLGCPSRTKFWSSDFCFAPKLNLGLGNFLLHNCPKIVMENKS